MDSGGIRKNKCHKANEIIFGTKIDDIIINKCLKCTGYSIIFVYFISKYNNTYYICNYFLLILQMIFFCLMKLCKKCVKLCKGCRRVIIYMTTLVSDSFLSTQIEINLLILLKIYYLQQILCFWTKLNFTYILYVCKYH